MNKTNKFPYGISLFVIFLIGLEIYYFYSFITEGLFRHYGYTLSGLTSIIYPIILLILFTITYIVLAIAVYGFIFKRSWTRRFTIFFLIWASLWPIWGLIVNNLPLQHLIILVVYAVMLVYLLTESVKEYFITVFRCGEWILYKRDVDLKSGKPMIIHFFSRKTPKSGVPTRMPEGYEVMISDRSNMPYLRKTRSYRRI